MWHIEQSGFENADIVFATDGECKLPDAFQELLAERRKADRFTITGILLDKQESFVFSLEPFCETIYRTSELSRDTIARSIVTN